MIKKKSANEARLRRHRRVRKKVSGTGARPRLSVFRSGKHIYAQIIDDEQMTTLVAASSREPDVAKQTPASGSKADAKPRAAEATAAPASTAAQPKGDKGAEKGDKAKGKEGKGDAKANASEGDAAAADENVDKLAPIADNRRVLQARLVGRLIAQRAKDKGIAKIVFDRGGYLYHGRVAALAAGAREGGLDF